ncbi:MULTISPECIES: ATP-dependent helicase [unclassified Halorhodospira]|uniref:ATP-dependent helicase n=1 Tax=unclassified Halorhodospira TaxID=2626748 RepID=UPI001EE93D5A|nr:ATP-dependent helicase [Halorhodospira sp. M39old]MCG5545506.1 ATP-dependent helicase [Halorhodospira sp. M38]
MAFTPEQRQVIEHPGGHARVSAAAGSGKTATLVARVIELLRRGADPARIRVLMFNRSAREDFERRLALAIREAGRRDRVSVQTFHSAGYRLLQRLEAEGVVPRRRLESAEWVARKLARNALEAALEDRDEAEAVEDDAVDAFLAFVDVVKADTREASVIHAEAPALLGTSLPGHYLEAYRRFEALRDDQQLRLLNDLIHEPVQALLADDALARRFRNHFDHLIIDEYQDVNEAQQQLIRCIAGERAAVMVVGDPDQCVYQWRGARPEYIVRRFDEDFPGAAGYTLPHTFRFGHTVALLGNHSVVRNRQRDGKLCLAAPDNPATEVRRCTDSDPELYRRILAEHRAAGGRLSDVAVLVRLYSLAAPLELELLEAGVPLRLEGRAGLFQRREVRALLGYLRYAAGLLREPLPDGAGPAELLTEMLMLPVAGLRRPEAQAVAQGYADGRLPLPRSLARAAGDLPRWKGRRLRQRMASLEALGAFRRDDPVADVLDEIVTELSLYEAIASGSPSAETATDRTMMVDALRRFAASGGWGLTEFLERCDELIARSAQWQDAPPEQAVRVTSIHRAKGLEWPVVIVPGLAEGTFPYGAGEATAADLEAERRLFYVAVTRAQQRLYLVHPQDPRLERALQRGRAEQFDPSRAVASRFLAEAQPERSVAAGAALHRGEAPDERLRTRVIGDYLAALQAHEAVAG